MMKKRKKFSKFNFRILGTCMVCKLELDESNAYIINENEFNVYFHIDCPKCKSSSIIGISNILHPHITSFGILTDLTKQDFKRLDKIEQLTPDDVLTYHLYAKIK